MIKCLRCSKCCHYLYEGKVVPCKFLVKIGKKYMCRIYNNRLGQVNAVHKNGTKTVCMMRDQDVNDYVGCPYNTDKPIFDVFNEIEK